MKPTRFCPHQRRYQPSRARVEHFVGQLRRREHAALVKSVPPAAENPILLNLLRDRLVRAANEVNEALAEAPKGGEE